MQLSKTVYFRDYPASTSSRSGFTITFPETERDLWRAVAQLSSFRIRELLGFQRYSDLEGAARLNTISVTSYARQVLTAKISEASYSYGAELELESTFRGG